MTFNTGDRVMVKRFESRYNVDLTGFYGYVRGYYEHEQLHGLVPIVFTGCLDSAPDRDECQFNIEDSEEKPFPIHISELEHAD